MKRCPQCRRDYFDETLIYCLDDGSRLLEGPSSGSEAPTANLSGEAESFSDKKTAVFDKAGSDKLPATTGPSKTSQAVFFVTIGVVLLAAMAGTIWVWRKYALASDPETPSFAKFTLSKATTSGKAQEATISSDGKFIVYLEIEDDGNRSLWVKQMATGTAIPVVPPSKGNVLRDTAFSPDGNFIYYNFTDRRSALALYKVSSLGGTPKKLRDSMDGPVAPSPDGSRLAFTQYSSQLKSSIVTVNPDGGDEKVVSSIEGDQWFGEAGASWSPDGKTIALMAGVSTGDGPDERRLVGVDVADGSVRELSPKRWVDGGRVVWLPDGKSLILIACEKPDAANWQVWQVNYPSGVATQITNDVLARDNTSLGVTADGRTLLTVTVQRRSRIESVPATGASDNPTRLSRNETDIDGLEGIDVLADGRVVFVSNEGGQPDLWIMNADGSSRQKITSDAFREAYPELAPDERSVFFASNRPTGDAAVRLWRTNLDGTGAAQVGASPETAFSIAPDGKSLVFSATQDGVRGLRRLPLDGGEAVRLTDFSTGHPAVSPDGKWISVYAPGNGAGEWRYGILPIDGGPMARFFEFPRYQYQWVRWRPDGRGLSFVGAPSDPSNIWLQPVDGGAAKQLTDFDTGYIFRHEWSRDGKTLYVVRGRPAFDVVLQTVAK